MVAFVVQYHEKSAEDHHYDLMLEWDGVLRTWSFPQPPQPGVILEGKKIFDHRLRYLTFEGEIGRGLGRVTIWDSGNYELIDGGSTYLDVRLEGQKLHGQWRLQQKEGDFWQLWKVK